MLVFRIQKCGQCVSSVYYILEENVTVHLVAIIYSYNVL